MRYRTKLPRAVPLINNLVMCLFLTREDRRASRANILLKIRAGVISGIRPSSVPLEARGQGLFWDRYASSERAERSPQLRRWSLSLTRSTVQGYASTPDSSAKTSRELTCTNGSRLNRGRSLFQYTLREPQLKFPVARNRCLQSCRGIDPLILNAV